MVVTSLLFAQPPFFLFFWGGGDGACKGVSHTYTDIQSFRGYSSAILVVLMELPITQPSQGQQSRGT